MVWLDLGGRGCSVGALYSQLSGALGQQDELVGSADTAILTLLRRLRQPLWIMLDDYPRDCDAELDACLDMLLDIGPTSVSWWVSSRRQPAWKLPRLLLQGHLCELDAEALALLGTDVIDVEYAGEPLYRVLHDLLADPHLPWWGGNQWYEAHLKQPGGLLDVTGAAVIGTPMIAMGRNERAAWSMTSNGMLDFADCYKERLVEPWDLTEYLYAPHPSGKKPIVRHTVTVQVKGAPPVVAPAPGRSGGLGRLRTAEAG